MSNLPGMVSALPEMVAVLPEMVAEPPLEDGDALLFRITFRPEFEDSATDTLLIEVDGDSRRIELLGRGDDDVRDGTNEQDEEAA